MARDNLRALQSEIQEDLPNLSSDQVEVVLWAAQVALMDGQPNFRMYSNNEGELCIKPVHGEKPIRAS